MPEPECSLLNPKLCSVPPLSITLSPKTLCEEGTFTIILAVIVFAIFFIAMHAVYHWTEANTDRETRGILPHTSFRLSKKLEYLFVKPFIPNSVETFITQLASVWFLFTIPMAITRYYEKRWAVEVLAQHGPFNFMVTFVNVLSGGSINCNGIDMNAINYTETFDDPVNGHDQPEKRGLLSFLKRKHLQEEDVHLQKHDYENRIDYFFTLHLAFAILWLIAGFLQIYLAQTGWSERDVVRVRAHQLFGRCIALPALAGHFVMSSIMVVNNPVKQSNFIVFTYVCYLFTTGQNIYIGIQHAKQAREAAPHLRPSLRSRHKVAMLKAYVWSTFGSGAIRLTAWMLWCFAKFFPIDMRIKMDRGECQTNALALGSDFMGEADYCIQPVYFNLYLTVLLENWLVWVFLCVLDRQGNEGSHYDDKLKVKMACMNQAITISIYLLSLYFLPGYDQVCVKIAIVATSLSMIPSVRNWIKRIIQNEESHLHRPFVAFYGVHDEAHYVYDDDDHEHNE